MIDAGIRETLDQNAIFGVPKRGVKRFWTTREEAVLRENYPQLGVEGCLPLLPGRSASSVYQRVFKIGLRRAGRVTHNFRKQIWTTTPQIDALIARVVQGPPSRTMMKDLARTLSRPRWWVSKRAAQLGLVAPRFKELPWSEAELELASANAHRSAGVVRRLLLAKGFKRTETAILVRLKRDGFATGKNADANHFTGLALSKAFGIDNKTVSRWITQGLLRAKRRGTARVAEQGGDEWWIARRDVRTFVIDNVHAVDFRKVDKVWLVDLLAHKEGA